VLNEFINEENPKAPLHLVTNNKLKNKQIRQIIHPAQNGDHSLAVHLNIRIVQKVAATTTIIYFGNNINISKCSGEVLNEIINEENAKAPLHLVSNNKLKNNQIRQIIHPAQNGDHSLAVHLNIRIVQKVAATTTIIYFGNNINISKCSGEVLNENL
jgi:hypothetical protein